MPRIPKKAIKEAIKWISSGSGITEGLELMLVNGRFVLKDDGGKFTTDVILWNQPNKTASTYPDQKIVS